MNKMAYDHCEFIKEQWLEDLGDLILQEYDHMEPNHQTIVSILMNITVYSTKLKNTYKNKLDSIVDTMIEAIDESRSGY